MRESSTEGAATLAGKVDAGFFSSSRRLRLSVGTRFDRSSRPGYYIDLTSKATQVGPGSRPWWLRDGMGHVPARAARPRPLRALRGDGGRGAARVRPHGRRPSRRHAGARSRARTWAAGVTRSHTFTALRCAHRGCRRWPRARRRASSLVWRRRPARTATPRPPSSRCARSAFPSRPEASSATSTACRSPRSIRPPRSHTS